jgi:hypothetical protein
MTCDTTYPNNYAADKRQGKKVYQVGWWWSWVVMMLKTMMVMILIMIMVIIMTVMTTDLFICRGCFDDAERHKPRAGARG